MRLLELFAGTHSVSKVVSGELGWDTVSLDIDPTHNPDLCMDILDFDQTQYSRDYFDFVWASPDCASYSIARSRSKGDRGEAMRLADMLVAKTRQIIDYFECAWCIENPESSLLWKREVAHGLLESSCVTSYCSFGMLYRKNTRLANSFELRLPCCMGAGLCPAMVGSSHMEHAQQGGGGVSNRSHSRDELHRIPRLLVLEIFSQFIQFVSLNMNKP